MSSPSPWIKASKSADNNACVELRRTDRAVEVRDSKDQTGPVLAFTPGQLAGWLEAARSGELDQAYWATPMPACGPGCVLIRTLTPGARLAWLR